MPAATIPGIEATPARRSALALTGYTAWAILQPVSSQLWSWKADGDVVRFIRGLCRPWSLFNLVLGLGGGGALLAAAVESFRATQGGAVGTFTATELECGRGGCHWSGTFLSDDGTVSSDDVHYYPLPGPASDADLLPPVHPTMYDDFFLGSRVYDPGALTWLWLAPVATAIIVVCVGIACRNAAEQVDVARRIPQR